MDNFFEYDLEEAMLWLAQDFPVVNQSAFVRYTHQPTDCVAEWSGNVTRNLNVNKRVIEFLNKTWAPQVNNAGINNEKERTYKHMINERMRRDKQKQNYVALHKLLPLGTKGDKNSIIQMTTKRIEELQKYKNELRRQNYGLETRLQQQQQQQQQQKKNNNGSRREVERGDIRLNVTCPSSAIDSMLEVLKCLKTTNHTRPIAIQSTFSPQNFSALLQVETKIGVAEVEKVVNRRLWEVEKKYRIISSEI